MSSRVVGKEVMGLLSSKEKCTAMTKKQRAHA